MQSAAVTEKKAKKVLIVEDEGEMCLVLNILLNGEDLELDHVPTLAEAADYLEKEKPEVVILDNKLPDGFGVDAIAFIKKYYPSIRIIMISGFDGAAKDAALASGADFYLEKPFTKAELYNSIEKVLN